MRELESIEEFYNYLLFPIFSTLFWIQEVIYNASGRTIRFSFYFTMVHIVSSNLFRKILQIALSGSYKRQNS